MASKTDIANLALSHIGVANDISNLDSEKSNEARACNRFYDQARRQTLRDFPWPFAKRMATLALVTDYTVSDTMEWDYAYRYPSDCVLVRRISNETPVDTACSEIPYEIMGDDTGQLIMTNLESAGIDYTTDITNTALFPDDFVMALSLRLAVYIAPRITAGDPFKMGDKAAALYQGELSKAQATAINEGQVTPQPESEIILSRR